MNPDDSHFDLRCMALAHSASLVLAERPAKVPTGVG